MIRAKMPQGIGAAIAVRRAEEKDTERIMELLDQVNLIHHEGRSDIFRHTTKYSIEELAELMKDDERPIFVMTEKGKVLAYCFCIIQQTSGNKLLQDRKSLYIDDFCVDEGYRGKNLGRALYEAVKNHARALGCDSVTLNVWEFNSGAKDFYESCGLKPLRTIMEDIL